MKNGLKISEARELTVNELKKKVADLRRELLLARFAQVNQQLKNPLKRRQVRRDIARLLTVIREKGDK